MDLSGTSIGWVAQLGGSRFFPDYRSPTKVPAGCKRCFCAHHHVVPPRFDLLLRTCRNVENFGTFDQHRPLPSTGTGLPEQGIKEQKTILATKQMTFLLQPVLRIILA